MDELMQSYIQTEKKELFHDCKYRADLETWLNRAYAMMLVEQGFLTHEAYAKIDKGLVAAGLGHRGGPEKRRPRPGHLLCLRAGPL